MPNKCTICARPDYKEVIGLLKEGASVNSISVRYHISYDSLRRCFKEHTYIDPLSPSALLLEIKAQEKALAVLRKTRSEGSMDVHRLKQHIKSLRSELRDSKASVDGSHGGVRPDDPETWPAWLPGFLSSYFDMLTSSRDREGYRRSLSAPKLESTSQDAKMPSSC